MRSSHLLIFAILSAHALACGDSESPPAIESVSDVSESDVSESDVAIEADSGKVEGDISEPDTATSDAGVSDTATVDAGASDAEAQDTSEASETVDSVDTTSDTGANDSDTGANDTVEQVDVDDVIGPCEPPISMDSESIIVSTFDYLALVPSGGTGAYRFELITDGSGAIVNELTGAYLSGGSADTVDIVRITDQGCEGAFELTIQVVGSPVVTPIDASIPPNSCLQLAVTGGSGEFLYQVISTNALGTIDAKGVYQAGAVAGPDIVRVKDAKTGRLVDVEISIDSNALLQLSADHLILPIGSSFVIQTEGGSGGVDAIVDDQSVSVVDGVLQANDLGSATLTVKDKYVKCVPGSPDGTLAASMSVTVVSAVDGPKTQIVGFGRWGDVRGPGDLNDDGFPDAVVSQAGSHLGAFGGGAAFIYHGSSTGLSKEPVQTIFETQRDSRFGRRLEMADMDNDGRVDLLVSAILFDSPKGGDRGRVVIYKGLDDGTFESVPLVDLHGLQNGEQFGSDMTACDFNKDGFMDLAVGAYRHDHKAGKKTTNDTGAIYVFLGSETGFSQDPNQKIHGVALNDSGEQVPVVTLEQGRVVASGDFDGDGFCDLVGGTTRLKVSGAGNGASGLVVIHRGTKDGVTEAPVKMFAPPGPKNTGSEFGYAALIADFNGDKKGDLVVGQWKSDEPKDNGAVRIFSGTELTDEPASEYVVPDAADWSFIGAKSDFFGVSLDAADLNADGHLDLISSAFYGEVSGHPGNTGTIEIFYGQADGWPETKSGRDIPGLKGNDRFGYTLAAIGDLNGDKQSEIVTFPIGSDFIGIDYGNGQMAWGEARPAIQWNSEWKYHDQGVDLGPDWFKPEFVESGFKTGQAPFGYGENDEKTLLKDEDPNIPTVYFRKTINLPLGAKWAELSVKYDDGVMIWINGNNIFSTNMDKGTDYKEWASKKSKSNQLSQLTIGLEDESPFIAGDNVIAVMIKQIDANNPTLSFSLSMVTHADDLAATSAVVNLDAPAKSSGSKMGYSAKFVPDLNSDGKPELLVGVRDATPPELPGRSGQVMAYSYTGKSVDPVPFHIWNDIDLKTGDSHLGQGVGVGDFNGDKKPDVFLLSHKQDRWNLPENVAKVGDCKNIGDSGAVFVMFNGGADGFKSKTPGAIVYGHQSGQRVEQVLSNVDYNGDGKDDVVYSSSIWDAGDGRSNAGGVAFVAGRKGDSSGKILGLCEPDTVFYGTKKDDRLGIGIASMGDFDNDGCDDIVAGAFGEDLGVGNQGTVRIFYGWGNKCKTKKTRMVVLNSGSGNATAGWAIAAGADLDGDGVNDIATGGPDFRDGSLRLGAVWLIPGAYIQQLPTTTVTAGILSSKVSAFPFTPEDPPVNLRVKGDDNYSRFGESIAFIKGTGATGAALMVGSPLGNAAGVYRSGGAYVYEFDASAPTPGLQTRPSVIVAGESYRPSGRLGQVVHSMHLADGNYAAIGGYYSSPAGDETAIDNGGVYGFEIPNLSKLAGASVGDGIYKVPGEAGEIWPPEGKITYVNGAQKVLQKYCAPCHQTQAKGGTNFASNWDETQVASIYCSEKTVGECTVVRIIDGTMDKGVSDVDLGVLTQWVENGMPDK